MKKRPGVCSAFILHPSAFILSAPAPHPALSPEYGGEGMPSRLHLQRKPRHHPARRYNDERGMGLALDKTEGAIKSLQHRALASLQKQLAQQQQK